jgi:hypothetical protein
MVVCEKIDFFPLGVGILVDFLLKISIVITEDLVEYMSLYITHSFCLHIKG